jgi:uncharacterized protein (DUF1810 family)
MTKPVKGTGRDDSFELSRFLRAQQDTYEQVIAELTSGRKQGHWMWFTFPQIDGLGYSTTTKYYAIKSIDEARQYLQHPILGNRLVECAKVVCSIVGRSVTDVFGHPDDLKLKSSMTLFDAVAESNSVFASVLEKYFGGERDTQTLSQLERLKER